MSILVDKSTRLLVQGITGREGRFHALACRDYDTHVVAGVTPGRGGLDLEGIPVFNTVEDAVRQTGANVSLVLVPAPLAADAILEAADAGLPLVVCITEGIPVHDMLLVRRHLERTASRLIGPNCPGVITPGASKVGIMPGDIFLAGNVGIVSRSGTLTYEAASQLTALGIGQSTCVGLGGDPIVGTSFVDILRLFQDDAETQAVVLIGEIGGAMEQQAAEYIRGMTKPVAAFIAGASAPSGRRMGHAGAIIAGAGGTARAKQEALAASGARIVPSPAAIGETMATMLRDKGP